MSRFGAARGVGRSVTPDGLGDVALDGGLEKQTIAAGGKWIRELVTEFLIGQGEGFAGSATACSRRIRSLWELACGDGSRERKGREKDCEAASTSAATRRESR